MTSDELRTEHFIDFHTHKNIVRSDTFSIYSYAPGINEFNPERTFSCGIHPWEMEHDFCEIERLSTHENCLFIGESGLDRAINTPIDKQIELFKKHIELSESVKKPLVIHCVRAFDLLFQIHKDFKPKQVWILHDFNGSQEIIKGCLERGFYLSLGPRHMAQETKLLKSIVELGLNNIFFETDDSTESIQDIYKFFASTLQQDVAALKRLTYNNLKRIVNL